MNHFSLGLDGFYFGFQLLVSLVNKHRIQERAVPAIRAHPHKKKTQKIVNEFFLPTKKKLPKKRGGKKIRARASTPGAHKEMGIGG